MRRCHILGELESTIYLTQEQTHYLSNVLRLKDGDQWVAFNGDGLERIYCLNHLQTQAYAVGHVSQGRTARPIHLCYALPKGDKLERVIKQVSELGIESIALWQADHCVQQWKAERSAKKLQRLQKIIQESARQSHRADVLTLHQPQKLSYWLNHFEQAPCKIFLHTKARYRLKDLDHLLNLSDASYTHKAVVLVGPEGGISDEENHKLIQAGWIDIYLDTPILRTETAAVIACGLLLQYFSYL